MGKKIDLTGQRFGKWMVLRECEEKDKHGNISWECLCDCGKVRDVRGKDLRCGHSKSCGCITAKDLTGQTFGKLTVIKMTHERANEGSVRWLCKCECGEYTTVSSALLTNGTTQSCGCLRGLDLVGLHVGRWTILKLQDNHNKWGQRLWSCECECGNVRTLSTCQITSGKSKSCGCLRLELISGEKNHNYNPDLTDLDRMNNRYQLYGESSKRWARKIYNCDGFTCQGCGNYSSNLNAHHLNAWNAFPEQRFDTANGITLCEDCHKEFHHFNGYGDNTIEQFRDHIACTVGEEYVSEIEETLLSRESEIIGQEQEQPTRELQAT